MNNAARTCSKSISIGTIAHEPHLLSNQPKSQTQILALVFPFTSSRVYVFGHHTAYSFNKFHHNQIGNYVIYAKVAETNYICPKLHEINS